MESKTGWLQFLNLCREAQSLSQLESLFDLFFTPEEKEQMGARVRLVFALLKSEKTQREIAREFNISIAKITRGSNALKSISDELRDFLMKWGSKGE